MPNLAGLFDRRRDPDGVPGALEAFSAALSVGDLNYRHARWHDGRFGAVNLLNDLAACQDQPAVSADRNRVLFLDGEVYNLGELARAEGSPADRVEQLTPCELCLALYEALGPGFVARLNGQFNIAVYDAATQTLRLYTDHLADRPLYYLDRGGVLYFALEQKAILAALGEPPRPDERGVVELLAFGHFLGDRTLFEGVTALPQGSVLTADRAGVRVEQYWRPAFRPARFAGGLREAAAEFAARMAAAVARRARRRAPLGIFLSGGLDSRFVGGALARTTTDVTAFTIGPETSRDVRYGRELAARLGFRHRRLPPVASPLDPGVLLRTVWRNECAAAFTDCTSIEHHRAIRPEAGVILNGHLGDALSGGHMLPNLFFLRGCDQLAAHILAKRTVLGRERLRRLVRPDAFPTAYDRLRETVIGILRGLGEDRVPLLYGLWDLTVRQRRYTLATPAVDRYLLEQLSPFLDNGVHEFALSLPVRWLFGQRCYIRAILGGFPEIARVPWARTGRPIESYFGIRLGKIGGEVLWRRARRVFRLTRQRAGPGQADAGPLQGPQLRAVAEGYLDSAAFPAGLLDRDQIRGLIGEHFERGGHHAEVSLLLTLAAGARLFLERPVRGCPAEALPALAAP